ncbi:MAG: glycosyltransferase [Sphingomonadales bacterium]|nr:glycosyltransferase [Sphingomonadales bacterium]
MPILSVIIPTHERFRYAKETVETILGMHEDIELIVSDTSAVDPWTSLTPHPRLKVVRPGTGISVVDNFNSALPYATGDYVCFISDDDLIVPEIVDIARKAKNEGVDAINFTFPVIFYWKDYLHRSDPEAYSGTVWISQYSGRVQALDTEAALREATGSLGHGVFSMPRSYCGLISLSLIKRILTAHDALFGGVSPDIYSAALISAHAAKAVEVDFPAVIPGASGASTAGQSAAGRHLGALRDNDHIRPFRNLVWHPLVPEFYSVPTVWAYSLVRAVERLPENSAIRPNWGRLYARCLLHHRAYWRPTLSAMKAYAKQKSVLSLFRTLISGMALELAWAMGRARRRLSVRLKVMQDRRIGGIASSHDAAAVIGNAIKAGPPLSWSTAS